MLEETIDQAPQEIEKEKDRGIQRFGKAFEDGDHVAIIALQRITIELQSDLLEHLREAARDDDSADFMALVDAGDMGRDRTISTLLDLRQRLLHAGPSNQMSGMSLSSRDHSGSVSQPQPRESAPDQVPSHRHLMKHRRTLTPEKVPSGYGSNAEDTASGAEENKKHAAKHRNKSFFGFLGHHRVHSYEQVPRSEEDATPQPAASQQGARNGDDGTSMRSGSTAKAPSSYSDGNSVRSGSFTEPRFTYEEGDDSPFAKKPNGIERRDTHVAPDSMAAMSRQPTYPSVAPSMTSTSTMTRTFSNTGSIVPHAQGQSSIAVPQASTENSYLGFCKGAWRLQTGDRKGLVKCKDYMYSAQAGVFYLSCSTSKCAFAGHYNPAIIWDKVWIDQSRGLKFRWPFLAKSHVQQKTVTNKIYNYQCLFCVFLGITTPVMHGMELYLDHIAQEHRGHTISEVVLYKCGAINDREAEDGEEFDMNMFPLSVEEYSKRKESNAVLSDDLMTPDLKRSDTIAKDSMFSNEPWNEGLSDFHYGGNNEFDYTSMYDRDFHSAELEG